MVLSWLNYWFSETDFLDITYAVVADVVASKLQSNNIFLVTKLSTDGRQLLYLSVKLSIGIWILCELKLAALQSGHTLALKSRVPDVYLGVVEAFQGILLS